MDANENPINPTGTDEVIPRAAETTEEPAGPATAPEFVSQEDQEIADLKATMESETATPDEKESARRGFQDRMERKQLRKQAEDAKIEAAEERGRRLALETVQPAIGTPTAPPQYQPPVFPEPEPKLEDFTKKDEDGFEVPDTESFVKSHTNWGVRKYAWDTGQVEENRRSREWGQQGEAKAPGFLKKAKTVAEKLVGPQGNDIGQAITTSDVSHELVLYLADNPSEVSRLMSSPRAQVEIGKIEARIATAKAGNARTTNAPNPGEPLKPTTSVETFDPMKADAHTYATKFHPACPEWIKNRG